MKTITAKYHYGSDRRVTTYTEEAFRAHMNQQVTWWHGPNGAEPHPGRLAAVDAVLDHVLNGVECHPSAPGACVCYGWTTYTAEETNG